MGDGAAKLFCRCLGRAMWRLKEGGRPKLMASIVGDEGI